MISVAIAASNFVLFHHTFLKQYIAKPTVHAAVKIERVIRKPFHRKKP